MKKLILSSILLTSLALADGAATYSKCVGCHGSAGEKKALGKATVLQNVSKEDINKALLGYKAGTLSKFRMGGLMKSQVSKLSDDEILELSEYISTFKKDS